MPSKKRKRNQSLDESVLEIFEDLNRSFSLEKGTEFNPPDKLESSHQDIECFDESSKTVEETVCEPNESELNDIESNASEIKHPGVSKTALLNAIRLLRDNKSAKVNEETRVKKKFSRSCTEGYDLMYDKTHWESAAYLARGVRHLILNREWEKLKDMIKLLITHTAYYRNYVKELTFFHHIINADQIDPAQVDEYFQLCFPATAKSKMNEFDIWYCDND